MGQICELTKAQQKFDRRLKQFWVQPPALIFFFEGHLRQIRSYNFVYNLGRIKLQFFSVDFNLLRWATAIGDPLSDGPFSAELGVHSVGINGSIENKGLSSLSLSLPRRRRAVTLSP